MSSHNIPAKELIFVAPLLALLLKVSSWVISENWFLVGEKSGKCLGIFFIPVSGNPVFSLTHCYVVIKLQSQFTLTQDQLNHAWKTLTQGSCFITALFSVHLGFHFSNVMFICSFCTDYDLCEDCESKEGIHHPDHFFAKLRNHVPGIGRKNGEMVPVLKKFVYRMALKEEGGERKEEKKRYKEERKDEKRRDKDGRKEEKRRDRVERKEKKRRDKGERKEDKRRDKEEWTYEKKRSKEDKKERRKDKLLREEKDKKELRRRLKQM